MSSSLGNIVLIGSQALAYHGYNVDLSNSDYDLLVSHSGLTFMKSISELKQEKTNMFMMLMDDVRFDITLVNKLCDESLKVVFDNCINNPELFITLDVCAQNKKQEIRCCVCPLEILYALKKSHVHRILNCTSSKQENITIWNRHVQQYNWMREQLGYVTFCYDFLFF